MRELAEIKHLKIDNHNLTLMRCIFENLDNIIIYYEYNNNSYNTTLYYNLKEKKYLYGYDKILTKRQKTLLENKILKIYQLIENE